MTMVPVKGTGKIGLVKDLSPHELPINAWTDARNIRFLDGYASQFFGHSEVYNSPSVAPQYLLPAVISDNRYWIYATAAKCYVVAVSGGVATHTDITHATPRTGVVNNWTGTLHSGIPILNTGDTSKVPMYWDLNLADKFVDLTAWPAATYCKALRSFKNILVALHVTKAGTTYPHMVKWSHPSDPGALPSTWDQTDATKDAGELDLAEGDDVIVDGLQLRNSFMVYKERSVWRLDYVGGIFVLASNKVLGMSGAMNRNCIVEIDGFHLVLTNSDVVVHDGQQATSILNAEDRRSLFQSIDSTNNNLCFVFKNPYFNEAFICYPSIGSSVCDKALVYNYVDKTIGVRDLPNVNHAAFGSVDNTIAGTWAADSDPWSADLTTWDGPDYVPSNNRVIMASSDIKLYMLDASASFNGSLPTSYLERKGLSIDMPDRIKIVRGIRPRITGNTGMAVTVSVGYADDPYTDPTYTSMTHTIGTTVSNDCMVAGRYIAVKFSGNTAYQWRLDSFDLDVVDGGAW